MFDFIVQLYLSIVTNYSCFGNVQFLTDTSGSLNFNQASSLIVVGQTRNFMTYLGNFFNNSTSNVFPELSYFVNIVGTDIYFNPIHFWIGSILGVIVCVGLFFVLVKFLKWLFTLIPNALSGRI